MKISKIEFSNYRSLTAGSIDIDEFSTILVGPNDVGKTNILEGILAFGSRSDFIPDDVFRGSNEEPEITFHFDKISDDDRNLLQALPVSLTPEHSLTIGRRGNDLAGYSIKVDGEYVDLDREITSAPPEKFEQAGEIESDEQNAASEESIDDESSNGDDTAGEEAEEETEIVEETTEEEVEPAIPASASMDIRASLIPMLWEVLPRIERFEELSPLTQQVNIQQLDGKQKEFESARKLLFLAGVTDFRTLTQSDAGLASLARENAGGNMTALLQEHWKQDEELRIEIDYLPPNLHFFLKEATNVPTYPQHHSLATLQYISYLADILYRIREEPEQLVIVIDEPGLRLHPKGQKDLAMLFRILSEHYQLLFTSHSQYLIDKNFPGQIRLIWKSDTGTKIDNKAYHTSAPYFGLAYEPLRSLLGIGIGDTLLFDEENVIVEGPSDQMILCGFSQMLSSIRHDGSLNLNKVAIVPAGNAPEIHNVARLAKAWDLKVVGIYDSDGGGLEAVKLATKRFNRNQDDTSSLEPREIVTLADIYSDKRGRAIEDLFSKDFYFKAVNKYYEGIFGDEWNSLSARDEAFKGQKVPIAKLLDDYFVKTEYGSFDKVGVARELVNILRRQGVLDPKGNVKREFARIVQLLGRAKDVLAGKEPEIKAPAFVEKAEEEAEEPGEELAD